MKVTEISVYCWYCGKRFHIEIKNVHASRFFCSDKCRIKNFKEEVKFKKRMKGGES